MTDSANAGGATVDAGPAEELSLEEAGNIISGWSDEDLAKNQRFEGDPPEQDAPPEVSSKEDAAPPKEATGKEEPEADDPEEDAPPPIERPRSWAKELDEEWASYPREAQEKIAKREQERDTAIRRSQNEVAEQRKAVEAERSKAEQARQDYEAKLPALMQALQDANQGTYADIKTIDDVTRLAQEDPFRYLQWQAHQSKMAAIQADQDRANRERETEAQSAWTKHVQDEAAKFNDALSDADRGKLKDLMEAAPKFLEDKGFTQSDLQALWNGKDKLSLHDHRLQGLILDGMKYQNLQNAPKAVAAKPVPPVQKPGVPRQSNANAEIQTLERRLAESGSEADGWALLQAKMRAQSRRAK
jgi:hypothetical protein